MSVFDVIFALAGGLLAIGLAFAIVALLFVPLRAWLWISGSTVLFQFHTISVFGIYPSITLLAGLAPLRGMAGFQHLLKHKWFVSLLLLLCLQIISLTWAPNIRLGIRTIVYALPFYLSIAATYMVTKTNQDVVIRILRVVVWLSLLEAFLVVIFRIFPSVEHAFLLSGFARIFTTPNLLADVSYNLHVNVWDPGKAGGFFLFGNGAAVYLGITAILGWYLGQLLDDRKLKLIGVVLWVSVFFTGSKAGMIIATLVAGMIFLNVVVRARRVSSSTILAAIVILSVCVISAPVAYESFIASRFVEASSTTLDARKFLWGFAWDMFKVYPISGLGFGGWEERVPMLGRVAGLPPHNAFIILWAQSGLLSAFVGLFYVISILLWAWSCGQSKYLPVQTVGYAVFFLLLWLFSQVQGENFGLFGDARMVPIVGMSIGLLAGLRDIHSERAAG